MTPPKRKVVPIEDRHHVIDCEVGDVIEFRWGEVAIVTAWLNNGILGRWIDNDGSEGELTPLDHDQPIKRLRGNN